MKNRCLTGRAVKYLAAILLLASAWIPGASCDPSNTSKNQVKPRFIAYYFHTSKRCVTCKRIEQWSMEAIQQKFKDQIASGELQWRALNVEQTENSHFINEFQLYSKSVVMAEYKDGKPVRWENLRDIWTLSRDRQKYFDYVVREAAAFMGKK